MFEIEFVNCINSNQIIFSLDFPRMRLSQSLVRDVLREPQIVYDSHKRSKDLTRCMWALQHNVGEWIITRKFNPIFRNKKSINIKYTKQTFVFQLKIVIPNYCHLVYKTIGLLSIRFGIYRGFKTSFSLLLCI